MINKELLYERARGFRVFAAVVTTLHAIGVFASAIWLFFNGAGLIGVIIALAGSIFCVIIYWLINSVAIIFESHAVMHDKLDGLYDEQDEETQSSSAQD